MKTILIWFIGLLIILNPPKSTTPRKGDSSNPKLQALDLLKNRDALNVTQPPVSFTADQFLKEPPDPNNTHSIGPGSYVKLKCFLICAKLAGKESCQGHSDNDFDKDFHIECGAKASSLETQYIICEVTRYNKIENPKFTLSYVKTFIGKEVIITGWRFYDKEHENASENIAHRPHNWRGTCLEIHSVASITLAQ